MSDVLHPRPNPIVAAMYTLRDMDADVIIVHGPAGCGFMVSRRLEDAGVRVVTTGMKENDLIFGSEEKLVRTLRQVQERFSPRLVGVVGTCASMIIGENLDRAVDRSGIAAKVLPVDVHGCSGANTIGAIRALEVASQRGVIPQEEFLRQREMLTQATLLEGNRGLTSKDHLSPNYGTTKYAAARRIRDTLVNGGRVLVVLNGKKELAYGHADMLRAVRECADAVGGETGFIANLDPEVGLPRIRRYASEIIRNLEEAGVIVDEITGGLDEYPKAGIKAGELVQNEKRDLVVACGIVHAIPGLDRSSVLVSDQPREVDNYLREGFTTVVSEPDIHARVMGASGIVRMELADTLRQLTREAE
ncbi:MAG TPA: Ni-sirohydrochlorin a,c-diamide reductive cyclase catalytic subunit [Methanomassiliicoccales archaeon]|jgi:putative methanogenesis marker 13 metalloprotein|nr:Ni-sirohydrochlorin a,c-diamide reductive cyclase catalytic subunit [Methanomassiliicoccales archaeon]